MFGAALCFFRKEIFMETKFNQQKYINDFKKVKYDRVVVDVPKGRREMWRAIAESEGKSLNAFIRDIVENYISSDVTADYLNISKEK